MPSSQGVPCPKSSAQGAPSVEHGVPEMCSALIGCYAPSALIGSENLQTSPKSVKAPRRPLCEVQGLTVHNGHLNQSCFGHVVVVLKRVRMNSFAFMHF